jgi:hypothetical protein
MAYRSAEELQSGFWEWLFETPEGYVANEKFMCDCPNTLMGKDGWDVSRLPNVQHYLDNISLEQVAVLLSSRPNRIGDSIGDGFLQVIRDTPDTDYHPLSDSFRAFGTYLLAMHHNAHVYNEE